MDDVYELNLLDEYMDAAERLNIDPENATSTEIIGLCGHLSSNGDIGIGRIVEGVCKGSKKKDNQKNIVGEEYEA